MARNDELRLITRVASMYYLWGKNQSTIAKQLGLSQATVSRLINRSRTEGIVQISIHAPQSVYTKLEESLVLKFKLKDAIVVDSIDDDEKTIQREIGAAAAYYLETTVRPNEIIGVSSWSATLLALVDALHSLPRKNNVKVVQILGGVGNPAIEAHATRLISRMAQLINGDAIYLPVTGIVETEAARNVLLADGVVRQATDLFNQVSTALVGIGAMDPSPLLAQSGNVFTSEEMDSLYKQNAVGDILLRFFDKDGTLVETGLEKRVISMDLHQLRKVDHAIGIAGGLRKYSAILGALRGNWINILITDRFTAERLVKE